MARRRKSVYSGIGGQAVLEGVMMRNKEEYAIAVRKPDGQISVDEKSTGKNAESIWRKIPFIRGTVVMIDSLTLGMDAPTYSTSFYEDEPGTKEDNFLERIFGDKAESVVTAFTVFLSVAIAIGLFMVLPYAVSELLGRYINSASLILLIEGLLRILVFVGYVASIALMKDIKRLYQYHGAEHKCINCVESGRPLTVENVRKTSRFHKRCGTSFLMTVVLIGLVLCFFIRVDTVWMRLLLRIALIPVVAGISYEFIRLAGTKDGILLDIFSAPGIWLQHITTKEPDDSMIEVAIASVEAVFDWEAFQKKRFKTRKVKKTRKEADGSVVETGEETLEISVVEIEEKMRELGWTAPVNEDETYAGIEEKDAAYEIIPEEKAMWQTGSNGEENNNGTVQ